MRSSAKADARLLEEGAAIGDSYVVERYLGEGAFAEVYRVNHRFQGRMAMKVFKVASATHEEALSMLGEAILLSKIGHPNIVRVYDANIVRTAIGDCAYFTMEYVAMGSLDDFWKSFGASFIPVETSVDIMRQTCRGLAVAHGEQPPIVHRDIKPHNILVGYDITGLRVRVSDFGLAKRANPLTQLVTADGTLRFKPPEVFRDQKSDSCAGDVWGLGCVLYLMLTDRLPYEGLGRDALLRGEFASSDLVAPSALNTRVDPALDKIAMRALAPKPGQRYPNAGAMLADLERWKAPTRREGEDSGHSNFAKEALGPVAEVDEDAALALVEEAMRLARQPGKLMEAADMMEEAVMNSPILRDRFEFQIQLWRKGVAL